MWAMRCNLDVHCHRQLEQKTLSETFSEVRVLSTYRMSEEIVFEIRPGPWERMLGEDGFDGYVSVS